MQRKRKHCVCSARRGDVCVPVCMCVRVSECEEMCVRVENHKSTGGGGAGGQGRKGRGVRKNERVKSLLHDIRLTASTILRSIPVANPYNCGF